MRTSWNESLEEKRRNTRCHHIAEIPPIQRPLFWINLKFHRRKRCWRMTFQFQNLRRKRPSTRRMVAPTMARMVLPWIFQILSTAIQESGEGYVMNIDLNFESNRQKKLFMTDPLIYLSKKVNSAEVNYRRLTVDEKQLFENAKNSEVSSFLKTQAVRRCLSFEESKKAQQSDRVLRARWVLTWKGVPEESREEAAMERENNKESTYTADLSRKAKARIVLLGFQHPDLESPDFRTTSPVQSQLMKHLSLVLCSQRKWKLESLDLKTAFLQTGAADMESKELWTPGVPELRAALGL